MNGYGFTPQRAYKRINDMNLLQMVSIAIPLFVLFAIFGADKISRIAMIPSISLLVLFVSLCMFPSDVNYGVKKIVSVFYAWRYVFMKSYERSLYYVDKYF